MTPITVGRRKTATSSEIDTQNTMGMCPRFPLMCSPSCVAMSLFVVLVTLYTMFHSSSTDHPFSASGSDMYSVMIDAGSTGSRVHAYHFTRDSSGNPVLQSELFEQLKPGLSQFARKDDYKGGADSLIPLLDAAMSKVPAALRHATPITLKATAGLRMTGAAQSEGTLQAVRDLIMTYPFKFNPADGAEIMGGLSEAEFAWITVNYLQDQLSLPAAKTSVMLDLGGGSTQIAMALPASKGNIAKSSKSSDYKTSTLLGQTHLLYLHSFLGQGLMAGRGGIYEDGGESAGACVPADAKVSYEYNDKSWSVSGKATSSADGCMAVARKALRAAGSDFSQAVEQPQKGQPVFAMSYYFDRGIEAGLISPEAETGDLTPKLYHDAAERVCALSSAAAVKSAFPNVKDENANFLCTDLCFISTLLQDGFGLASSTPLKLAKAIRYNGERVETQWTLGASIVGV